MLVHAVRVPESQGQKAGIRGQEGLKSLWKDPEGSESKEVNTNYAVPQLGTLGSMGSPDALTTVFPASSPGACTSHLPVGGIMA